MPADRPVTPLEAGLILLPVAVGVAVRPRLPASVAIHFSAAGTPDTYVPRIVGILSIPAIEVVTLAVLRGAFRVDPPADPRIEPVTTHATLGLLSGVHLLVLAWNLGHPVPFDLVTAGIAAWGVLLVGYVLLRERAANESE